MRLKDSFHPYAALTIIVWSISFIYTKLALEHFSASSLGFLRYLMASGALLVMVLTAKIGLPHKEDIFWFLLSGASGFFLYMAAFNRGQAMVSSATASVVIATVPVITALLARIIYRERLKAFQWVAIAVEFAGVLLLTLMDGIFSINTGLFWLFLAAIVSSVYNLVQRKLTKKYTALQAASYSIFAGTLLLSVFFPSAIKEAPTASVSHWFYVFVLGVFSSAVGYITWSKAFTRAARTSQVTNYMFITPFLASTLGFLIAEEVPNRATMAGGSVILAGVFLFNFGDKLEGKEGSGDKKLIGGFIKMEEQEKSGIIWKDRKHFMWFPWSFTKYYIENERLMIQRGLLSTTLEETLLYRIVDITMVQTLGGKLFRTGNLIVKAKVDATPEIVLQNISHPREVRTLLSNMVEESRNARNVVGKEFYGGPGRGPVPPELDLDGNGIPDYLEK
ncbi:EamA family transporter [Lachnospiraceae bacterium 62-35]